jgi:hypothetical protein
MSIVMVSICAVRAGPRYPDDAAAVVVGDDRDVLVVTAVAQLVDADSLQAAEPVLRPEPCDDALDDQADGLPGDRHHRRDRRLVGALREVRHDLLERVREARACRRPRHHLRRHAASWALDAPRLILERDGETADVEVPPLATSPVVARRAAAASRAERRAFRGLHRDDELGRREPEGENARVLQAEQLAQ